MLLQVTIEASFEEVDSDWMGYKGGVWSASKKGWQPTPVFLVGQSQGQRSLEAYSPGGQKESDMTEHTSQRSLHLL